MIFGDYCELQHQPTIQEPWIQLSVCFYDTNGKDSGFGTSTDYDGMSVPYLEIDGYMACRLTRLWIPLGDNDALNQFNSDRQEDEWWGNPNNCEIEGNNWTVWYWDPRRSNGRFYVTLYIYCHQYEVGRNHTITIGGRWCTEVGTYTMTGELTEQTWTTYCPSPWELTKGEMSEYGKVTASGTISTDQFRTYVGVTNADTIAMPFDPTQIGLPHGLRYQLGNTVYFDGVSFTDQVFDYNRQDYYNHETAKVVFQAIKPFIMKNMFADAAFYQVFDVDMPGFVRARDIRTKASLADLWAGRVTLQWDADDSGGRLKDGTWRVYRRDGEERKLIANNLAYSEREVVDDDDALEYETPYTYEVVFVPSFSPEDVERAELTQSFTTQIERDFHFNDLLASNTYEDKIVFSWSHNSIYDASGSKPYKLFVQRSLDGVNWTDVKEFNITSRNTTDGRYEDTGGQDGLESWQRYYYRLKINCLGRDYISDDVWGMLYGMSYLTAFSASRGTYSNVVKLRWDAKQVGTSTTYYTVSRRPLGSNNDEEWIELTTLSGTAGSYSYDDETALPGSFSQYKMLVWTMHEGERFDGSETLTDGFSLTTGVISGRITYGTGTAVQDARVTLKQSNSDGDEISAMRSLRLSGADSGLMYNTTNKSISNLLGNDFSVQLYVNPNSGEMDADDVAYRLFDVEQTFGITLTRNEGQYLLGSVFGDEAQLSTVAIPADAWTHITCVYNKAAQTATFYVAEADTLRTGDALTGVVTPSAAADAIRLAYLPNVEQPTFQGYVDEFRFFTKALTANEILKNYNHPLSGSEGSLAIYYPLDEGLQAQTIAYDFSKSNGVANGRHGMMKVAATSSTYVPSEQQLSLMSYTDQEGNYVVRGVPFSGEGTNYTIIPTLGIHEFSPAYLTRFVSMSSLNHSGVDFEDVSSFPVSGKIMYAGTDYPVEGVQFYVDGNLCTREGNMIESAEDGTFTISVPIGDHSIRVEKNGHVFAAAGRYPADPLGAGTKVTFNREIKNLEFVDETLVNFSGRVVGGVVEGEKPVGFGLSVNNIGVAELVLSPLNDRYRMNVVKNITETSYSYDTNQEEVNVASASERIHSTSHRGAGADHCRQIYIQTDPETGEFSAMLPPLLYQVQSMKVVKSGLSVGEPLTIDLTNPNVELSDTLTTEDGAEELYNYNTLLRQVYHSEPTFTVTQEDHDDGAFGIDTYEMEDVIGKLTVDDIYSIGADGKVSYKYGGPVFVMCDPYTFLIEGYEEYTNDDTNAPIHSDRVPLQDVVVTINNALSIDQEVYGEEGAQPGQVVDLQSNQLALDSLGQATYKWKAGLPNIVEPYTRTISITYEIDDRVYQWSGSGLPGIILGDMPTGNNFVTAGPDLIDMIVRDPPGSRSNTRWTKGTVRTDFHDKGSVWKWDDKTTGTKHFGFKYMGGVGGIGAFTLNEISSNDDLQLGVHMVSEGENTDTWSRTVTTQKAISTNDDPGFVGADGDVFIGSSTNLLFGNSRQVNFHRVDGTNEVVLDLRDAMTMGIDYSTEFMYTQRYIKDELIPNYKKLRNSKLITVPDVSAVTNNGDQPIYVTTLSPEDKEFGSSNHDKVVWNNQATSTPSPEGPSYRMIIPSNSTEAWQDSIEWMNSQIAIWEDHLKFNEQQKVEAYNKRSNLESKKKAHNYSFDSGTNMTYTSQTTESDGYVHNNKFTCVSVFSNKIGFTYNKMGYTMQIENELGGGTHWVDGWENQQSAAFEYTLREDANTEALEDYNDAISVDVYEYGSYSPIFRTLGGQTSKPYEGQVVTEYYDPGTVIMEATMQIEKPQIDVDIPVVSDIPSGTAANYALRLGNASEIRKGVIYSLIVDDVTNPDGALISIDGKPLNGGQTYYVLGGETLTKSLQLKQTNASVLDYEDIRLIFSSTFEPETIYDDVFISAHFVPSSSPVTLALNNTLMNTQTGTDLTLTFRDFDRTYRGLKAFRLQYKKQGASDWTLLHEYVTDEADVTNNNELLPASGASVSYTLPMKQWSDGEYVFRVLSVSTYGTSEVTLASDELLLTKDMERPRPLGQPEPTDGILDIGDDLSVTFNENFIKGELTKEANFHITGVLNGAAVAHETALRMSNTQTTAETETSISLAGKDFSADLWINIDGEGTLLCHGQGGSKFTVSVDASNKLVVDIGSESYTSRNSLPTGRWTFLTMSYRKTEAGGELNAAAAVDAETIDLFTGQTVPAYDGNGPLAVGKQANGAMHEMLLWDEAHDLSSALLQRSFTKNPATPHLIGYWKMNEGEGTVITDYARNRHMKMEDETWYLNNVNKAVTLDNQQYLAINTSELSIFNADDYAVEFWVRGDKQTGDAQLIQMGDVALWTTANGTLQLTGLDAFKPVDQQVSMGTSATNILDNAWHHVALNVLRQGAVAVYVDGQRKLTTKSNNVGSIATNAMIVGAQRTTFNAENGEYEYDRFFTGQIDEVRVWGATLNGDLLAKNRKVRLTGSEDGLLAYYPFETKKIDEFSQVVTVGTAADLTGSGHSAELYAGLTPLSTLSYTDEAPAMRSKPTETNVSFNYTASDNKIVISIDEDAATIEGCTLNITVRDLRDVNGNYSVPAIWTAYVNQNQLVWKEDEMNLTIAHDSGATITATLINKGGQQQFWTLSNVPQWLTTSSESGQANPLEETTVTFSIDKSMPIGNYETTIYLTGNDDIAAPLSINVKVVGDEPEWTVDPDDYEHSMSIMATLDILGTPSSDSDDIVGVFIDDVCRGTTHLEYRSRYDNYYATIVVYGNNEDAGKPLQFKCYDASTGITYPVVKASLNGADYEASFDPSAVVGRYNAPLQLSAIDMTEQEITLTRGWNWISLGVITDDMSVPALFGNNPDIEFIKSKNAFMEYDDEWLGKPMTLNSSTMYMVQAVAPTTLKLTGSRVDAKTSPVILKTGWNWIGYNQLGTMSLDDALAGWNVQPDDIIKSQRGAAYYDDFEWVGSLGMMEPGKGYMIYSTADCQFNYPSATVFRGPRRSRSVETSETSQTLMFSPVDPSLYEGNMVVVAQVVNGSMAVADAEVGFFADDECRQSAMTDAEGRLCVTVPGSAPCMLTIRIFDGQHTYLLPQAISYVTDTTCGAPRAPIVIDLGTATGILEYNADDSSADTIYDLSGRKVNRANSLKKGVYIINGQKKIKRK